MEIWTDGSLVVHACEQTSAVRVLRDGAPVAEVTPDAVLPWKTPLAVDPRAGRVWAGSPLVEYRLTDLVAVSVHGGVRRVAALGDGRLAAVLGGHDAAARLAVGRPGQWQREVLLDGLGAGTGGAVAGLAETDAKPADRAIGRDPTLTVTQHGIVVADGQAGVVALFDHGLDLRGLWYAGGRDETELTGYATGRGVLVTARFASRHAQIGWLTPTGPVRLRRGDGAFALPASDDRIWCFSDRVVELLDADGNTLATSERLRGSVQAAHATGDVCVLGSKGFVHIATATGNDGIATRTVTVGGIRNVVGVVPPGVDREAREALAGPLRAALPAAAWRSGLAIHREGRGRPWRVEVHQVPLAAQEETMAVLRAAGLLDVTVEDPDW